ncbi:cation/calcium exchanger 1-like [Dendrobium catenatum]|uniref:Cation/calcium exchanger 1 n=1 Tax=Dendrobium catenatum TaxID=906689 RepID=A0A2I0V6S3_9ASPA|nr:cation/calcium exchanger 1-like [Dendrobium catenatum]PKU59109.1 Cation/calcium exchanger 1 [Dendrobium catenatum]
MALAFLYKAHYFFINLSFIFLLGFFFVFLSFSSPKQSSFLSFPPLSTNPDGCRSVESLNDAKTKCFYIETHHPCDTSGYIDYLNLFYCGFGFSPLLGHIVLVLWLLILLYLLGNTASQYFCPSLEGLSRVLKLSPTIAGVTLLSLGNGAPDVFSTIVSFDGAASVGLSSVLGGAFFVSTVVVGVISICCSSHCRVVAIDRVGFIRDLCFFLFTLFFLLLILSVGKVHILLSMIFVSLYILYVIVVSTSHCYRKEHAELGSPLLESIEVEQPAVQSQESKQIVKFSPLLDWVLFLLELPLYLPRRLTIPVVTEENWSKPFAVASMILSPNLLAILWNSRKGEMDSQESITVFLFAALIGIALGIIAIERTESSQPPKFILPWLAAGFLMSVVWTYLIAGELVSILVSIGHILGIRPSVLGVTVLAWGNSLGDLIANVAMAVNGGENGAQIAISGCYAGPIFNILIGLGTSLLFSSWASLPKPFQIPKDPSQFVIIGFLIGGLVWALVFLSRKQMKLNRSLGVGLIAIYSCFLCLRLLESLQLAYFGASEHV